MSPELITEELIARQPAEAQVIIRLLLAKLAEVEAELKALKKTSQNSSLPPSTQHPHAKPASPKRKRGGQPGHEEALTIADAEVSLEEQSEFAIGCCSGSRHPGKCQAARRHR